MSVVPLMELEGHVADYTSHSNTEVRMI